MYDYLVNPDILAHASDSAEIICLGRHGHGRIMPQEEINRQLVRLAGEGKIVVRLKGGDPAVFARGAEEAESLTAAGVSFEIVPGITAALAAGSYAGIPITHRHLASAVALVTGQQSDETTADSLDYEGLARFPGTLVFYMGMTTARSWTGALISAGKSVDTPATIIRRCSWPDQTRTLCTLGTVADEIESRGLRPPVIVIVGAVATLSQTLTWFERRPLFGQTVLVTRPLPQAASMRDRLAELGAQVLVQPAIEITEPEDWGPVDAALGQLDQFDWLVFSSANGVRAVMERIVSHHGDLRRLGQIKIAAIGPATAEELAKYHLKADLQPAEYRAEALAEALAPESRGKKFLLARASRGREVLSEALRDAGGEVEQVVVYTSCDVETLKPEVAVAAAEGRIDWVTVTSSAIARSTAGLLGDHLQRCQLASISPITSDTLRDSGHAPAVEATEYTTDGVIRAILRAVESEHY